MRSENEQWFVGEFRNGGDLVLIRQRLVQAAHLDSEHEWLVIVTHHLSRVQSNGLPESDYNDALQSLDVSIIDALEKGRGDKVFLVETCRGKRNYYAYARGFEAVGKHIHKLIEKNPIHNLSYRTALDPQRKFVREYLALLRL